MNPQLLHDITPRLIRDYGFKESKGFLRGGVCPNCKQKELYTSAEHPWVLRCGRLKKCGAEFHVKELYPDLFDNWSERFPATAANPNAAAEAYLRDGRGFDLEKIKGWYSQETFWDRESNQSSATVRFSLGGANILGTADRPAGALWQAKGQFPRGLQGPVLGAAEPAHPGRRDLAGGGDF